jgi:hemolysin III
MALAVVGTAVLLRQTAVGHGDQLQFVGVVVYGATLVALYTASTLSHSFETPKWRHFFRTVDQVCIFLLIAGTFTPMALTYLREGWWWLLFVAMWTAAIAGILAKLFLTRLNNVTMSAYVLLGWMPTVAVKQIMECVPGPVLAWMALGGMLYTLGTWFLARDERVPFFHAVWHVFVIAGSACHYYAVIRYVAPWES